MRALTIATALLVAACAPLPAPSPSPSSSTTPGVVPSFDPALLEPLAGLPACGPAPVGSAAPTDLVGLRLPPDAVIVQVQTADALTQVLGYVERTPIQLLADYFGRSDLEILQSEQEGIESELLYFTREDGGRYRGFVKAQATCSAGSNFVVVVGPEQGAPVPTPSGTAN